MCEQIEYRDFWDVPRLFVVGHKDKIYLFDSQFDEEIDEAWVVLDRDANPLNRVTKLILIGL